MRQKIDISHRTIVFTVVLILGLWMMFLIRDLLVLLFIAVIFMSALNPLVNFFVKNIRFPRALAIGFTYLIIITLFGGLLASLLPIIIEQVSRFIANFPRLIEQGFFIPYIDQGLLQSELSELSRGIFSLTFTLFDNILAVIFLLVLTYYLLLEKENLEKRIASLFVGKEERVRSSLVKIEDKLGGWVRGQVVLSLVIGLLSYIGLIVLNIPYALPLALLAGLFEVVPVIGPILSAIPAVLIALTISPVLALGVAAMFFVIQQLENHLIVPQVMQRAVGLNPLVVILAVAIGSKILGVAGALLAVPLAVVLQIVATEFIEGRS